MPAIHLLGTGSPFADARRTTSMLAAASPESVVAIDCGGDLLHHLLAAGIELDRLDALIITHEHPDHVAGFPLMMERLMMEQREPPLPVYGIPSALQQAQRCLDVFDTSGWDTMPDIAWHDIREEASAPVLQNDAWTITASPVEHSVPNVGLRIEHRASGRAVAYSCDTEPCDAVVDLARGADLLIHEATGSSSGHSSAEEAAQIARRADVKRCLLIHVPPGISDPDLNDAREIFPAIALADEGGAYEFS